MLCQPNERTPLPCKTWLNHFDLFRRCYSRLQDVYRYVHAPRHFLPQLRYDRILVDGRARPQAAVESLFLLRDPSTALVFIHDWNKRTNYHVVLEFYDIVEQSIESNQPGQGGLVVLRPKNDWRTIYQSWKAPSWWY